MICSRNWFKLALVMVLALSCGLISLQAQNSRPENTPILIQDGFGPFGENLPNDGLEYCCPTATTMGMYWLGSNGYTMLAPSTYDSNNPADVAVAQNLDLAIAGLIGTSPGGGTKASAVQGIKMYFGLKGLSSNSSAVGTPLPSSTQIGASLTGYSFTVLSVGWYHTTNPNEWVKKGGHCLALVNYVPGSPNSTVTIHNPMSETPQNPQVQEITNAPPANAGLNGHYQLQSGILSGPGVVPVLQGMFTFNPGIPPPLDVFVYDDYDISAGGGISVNTNGATLTAPARLVGTGSLTKNGAGSLVLETALTSGNTFSGGLIINEGSLVATQSSGTPVGTGSIILNGGELEFAPTGSGGPLSLNVSGNGSTFTYFGGTLGVTRGGYSALQIVLGGYNDGTTPNLLRGVNGSLIVAASGGLMSLGASEKVLVNGSGTNLPPITHGIVHPAIVGQDNDINLSGDFLTYNGTNGFTRFTGYVSSNSTNLGPGTNDTTVYENVGNQMLTENASVYALKVTNSTISDGAGDTLRVGAGGVAGLILNNGTITTSSLDFQNNQAVVYVSAAGGNITSAIQGTAGLVIHGPGTLQLSGNSTFTGGTTINSGTVMISGNAGQGDVDVRSGATFGGSGVVEGDLRVSGVVAPGNVLNIAETLTIQGNATFMDGSDYQWDLATLTDSSNGVAGIDWDFLQINGNLDLPSLAQNLFAQITLQFDDATDPNSGNAFWNENHTWEIAAVTGTISNFSTAGTSLDVSNPRWAQGRFALVPGGGGQEILLTYTIPEPASAVLVGFGILLLASKRNVKRRSR